MKARLICKVVVFSLMGVFLLACNSPAQKQADESSPPGQEVQEKKAEQAGKPGEQPSKDQAQPMNKEGGDTANNPALDFTLTDIKGQNVALTDFLHNKIILMNFWATWCPYCVAEIPHLNKIETTLSNQVKLLSIDILEPAEKVKKFAEQKGVKFNVLLDLKGEVARKYRIRGTPTSIVIDRKGNIAYYGYELDKAEKVIMDLLPK